MTKSSFCLKWTSLEYTWIRPCWLSLILHKLANLVHCFKHYAILVNSMTLSRLTHIISFLPSIIINHIKLNVHSLLVKGFLLADIVPPFWYWCYRTRVFSTDRVNAPRPLSSRHQLQWTGVIRFITAIVDKTIHFGLPDCQLKGRKSGRGRW